MIKRKRNIETICAKMGWTTPCFCDCGAKGYLTWKDSSQEEVLEIEKKTGVKCSLTIAGRIIVPYFEGK